jgi:hypothetical protein
VDMGIPVFRHVVGDSADQLEGRTAASMASAGTAS